MISIPLFYGTLICGMSGVASAQSVPFYPTARQTYYDVGIPGTYDLPDGTARHSAGHNEDKSARVRLALLLSRLCVSR